ncbi:histidine kinase [Streptococcus caviae]|uniref:ATP-binding protein n=1 Tax=Streptococcus sp. 'caviae' TaxID=1915004 RepID=UPI00094BA57C|nr:sensor histidine kinase [Streptococcus sp. 'caviae']OLN83134.1 two-component sensor histidine kinase [Streptococcus sp. 'caviae']
MNSYKYLKYSQYAKRALIFINLLAVIYYAFVYLFASKYIVAKNLSHVLLDNLDVVPTAPESIFFSTMFFFALFLIVMFYRESILNKKEEINDWLIAAEVMLIIFTFISLQFSYNGLFLLVFADVFYSYANFYNVKEQRYWLLFIFLGFGLLLISNFDLLSLVMKLPSLDVYISFFPSTSRLVVLFIKNFLYSLNIIVFIVSLVAYIMYSIAENHKIEEELRMAARANTELNAYVSLAEKIAEDKERKRIAREIHDTLGHALTGISAGIDAVSVLVDLNPSHAKDQLKNVSDVVREGIQDVRRSLEKMRPGALEKGSLKEALLKMIADYETLSKLQVSLDYKWDNVDLDITKEDIIFRLIQETITNSLRHGHARHVWIEMLNTDSYIIKIKDDGLGCKEIKPGYGLTQMQERLAIIGGRASFESKDGFQTTVIIPKKKGEEK